MNVQTHSLSRLSALCMAVTLCLFALTSQAQFFSKKKVELLPEEQAFEVSALTRGDKLQVNWSIADDYYMYRDQFSVASSTPGVQIDGLQFPEGVIEDDPEFGEVEVYFYSAELNTEVSSDGSAPEEIELTLKGQGCNKPVGVCYPPQTRTLKVAFAPDTVVGEEVKYAAPERSADSAAKSFWSYVLAALGAGILLSFTPCVLPMIPILAGVIAKEHNPGKLRSGWLACCYVAGTIVTYMIAGWVAGATGAQLQAHFQNPWVIGFICLLLLLLAASLFGWFKIQLPSSVQSKLNSVEVKSGSAALSSFALGLISALVVGACVSPILIVTLGAAITQGDPVLGMAIMGFMAAGMGILLILFGFGAGWILPKAGAWMQQIQVVFGLMVLGVAIYLASAFSAVPALLLWAGLLFVSGLYLWSSSGPIANDLSRSLIRAVALLILLWGAIAVLGGASGGNDILRPLSTLSLSGNQSTSDRSDLPFQTVTTLSAAKQLLADGQADNKPVLVDFYADWCIDCKRMHRTTFQQDSVATALKDWSLIEIDVTDTSAASKEVKRFFDVYGPPATLFIDANGEEFSELRQYGYLNEADFLAILARANN